MRLDAELPEIMWKLDLMRKWNVQSHLEFNPINSATCRDWLQLWEKWGLPRRLFTSEFSFANRISVTSLCFGQECRFLSSVMQRCEMPGIGAKVLERFWIVPKMLGCQKTQGSPFFRV